MPVQENQAKSILRRHKHIDSWFISGAGMNLYRGCMHNCIYCDGRAENYYVEGDFARDINVKINAPEVLDRELNPARKRKPFNPGFIVLGGGVNDSYQALELKYGLSREALLLIQKYGHAVHVLTKSAHVLRDLEIISAINQQRKAIVSFSFSSSDDKISKILEPGTSLPSERLKAIEKIKENGISAGVFLMPIVPFVTDKTAVLEQTLKDIQNAGADYVIYGGMTLKEGRQKQYLLEHLQAHYLSKIEKLKSLYKDSGKWGSGSPVYYKALHKRFKNIAVDYKIPLRIPAKIFGEVLTQEQLVYVILDQMNYLERFRGNKSSYGKLSWQIAGGKHWNTIAKTSEEQQIIEEILETGTCQKYEKLLFA